MSTPDGSVQEKIVAATIDCIERDGIQGVTIRRIAKEAGVNTAAINYYFRSKDNLIAGVLETTAKHVAADWQEVISAEDEDLTTRLQSFMADFLDGATRFPGTTMAHLYETLVKKDYDTVFVKNMNAFLKIMLDKLKAEQKGKSEQEIKLTIISLISALFLPAIAPAIFHEFSGLEFVDPRARRAYVEHLMNQFVPAG